MTLALAFDLPVIDVSQIQGFIFPGTDILLKTDSLRFNALVKMTGKSDLHKYDCQ